MKRLLCFALTLMMLCGMCVPAFALEMTPTTVYLQSEDDTIRPVESPAGTPFIANDRTYLPLRTVSEMLGCGVTFNDSTKTAFIQTYKMNVPDGLVNFPMELQFKIGSDVMQYLGATAMIPVQMDVEPLIIDDRMYVPIRFLAEQLHHSVTFDMNTRTTTLKPSWNNVTKTEITKTETQPAVPDVPAVDYDNPKHYTEEEVVMLAKLMYGEARGIKSKTELACLAWTVCNRVGVPQMGGNTIKEVLTMPGQFYYKSSFPTVNDHNIDLVALARDVCEKWNRERNGATNVGRVLPKEYMWYGGQNGHNWFRTTLKVTGNNWDYSWGTVYDS